MNLNLNNFVSTTKGELFGKGAEKIKHIIIDSRKIVCSQNSVFIAIVGDRHDGHKYVKATIKNGVKNFIVSSLPENYQEYTDCSFLLVKDTLKAFHLIIQEYRNNFKIPVIGITGSNGKTIIKEWLFELLKQDYNIVRSPKSYNSQVGVPLSVWQLQENTELAIFEAGVSQSGEMSKLEKLIKPTIGIFTNIGDAHQENFIDYKHKISEKLKLFENSEKIIYCKDYQIIDMQIKTQKNFDYEGKLFTWSKKYPADLYINSIKSNENTSKIEGKFNDKIINITIPFVDKASIENAINAWCLMLLLKVDNNIISERMLKLAPIAMRLELKDGVNNCLIINDSYNSDIGSLNIALDFLNQQNKNKDKTLILSDIIESGKVEDALYTEIADIIKKKNITKFIGIGKSISNYTNKFTENSEFYTDTDEFISKIKINKFVNQDILLKGARIYEFERISNILQEKVHETVLEVNLNSVINNLNYYKSLLHKKTKLMVMVKAFSYGSGIYEIANILQYHGVDYLTVAYADEGVELRKAGITLPIMVMNSDQRSFDVMLEHQLEPEIYNFRILKAFYNTLRKNGIVSAPIHIKIDTGMKRLGFEENEITELIEELKTKPEIEVKSIFSHLVGTDDENLDNFTENQIFKFRKLSSKISDELHITPILHILNTSGIERFPNQQFDMVRLGIGLYGFGVNKQKLEYVNSLKTIITQIKNISANETIGYNRKGKMINDGKIAIIPIGYADGLNRRLSNGVGSVLINNQKAKIIGNICMDMTMVDISNIDAKEGDSVIIFNNELTIEEIAENLGTIPYEVLTGISRRVKRVYYQE